MSKNKSGTARQRKSVKPTEKVNGNGTLAPTSAVDWKRVATLMLTSRALDEIEEERLVPAGLVTYQFSSRGHDLAQILLGLKLSHPRDAAALYYRSRPFVLTVGLTPEEAIRSTMGRSGGISEGRDIGVVHNMPSRGAATVLPTSGDVGAQYTPAVGWAQAIRYRTSVMGDDTWTGAMAVALGGDASCATNGFWSALTIAATERLPYLFFIEDNGYGISVPGRFQTPGANIAENLRSFQNLKVISGTGTDPVETSRMIDEAVTTARSTEGPVLLRLAVPRLCGHSFVDTQAYKPAELVECENADDPLPKLRDHMIAQGIIDATEWTKLEDDTRAEVLAAVERAIASAEPDRKTVLDNSFYTPGSPQQVGGMMPEVGEEAMLARLIGSTSANPSGPRMNLIDAVRRTLAGELESNERVLLFGEDVGAKGTSEACTRTDHRRSGQLE